MTAAKLRRAPENPILTPDQVRPSRPDLRVVGVFNPAVVRRGEETVLLLRVAEAPREVAEDEVASPIWDAATGRLDIRRWKRGAPGVDTTDPRETRVHGELTLTSISHLRRARSRDGLHFEVDDEPALVPGHPLESFGIEDARITPLDGQYLVNYTAVSPHGIATALATSRDLVHFERRGILFAPPNRDVTIFPERVGGRVLALHRPMTMTGGPGGLGHPSIWLASSPDGLAFGDHRFVAGPRPGAWDDLKIGGGAVPLRLQAPGLPAGWLAVYHGVSAHPLAYSLGALLLDAQDPARVLLRSRAPLLAPEAPYERSGFFGNVVFTCGLLAEGEELRIYYGAADGVTAVADVPLAAVLAGMA